MNSKPSDPPPERSIELEARFAWLERHVTEQDKAVFDLGEELRRLKREVQELRKRLQAAGETDATTEIDQRPPHY